MRLTAGGAYVLTSASKVAPLATEPTVSSPALTTYMASCSS